MSQAASYLTLGFTLGMVVGVFVVGIFAPWLVQDTADKLERDLADLEEEIADSKKRKAKK